MGAGKAKFVLLGVVIAAPLAAMLAPEDVPKPVAQSTDATVDAQKAPPAVDRAGMLYENHCRACHEANAHLRDQRKARNLDEIRAWVTRWSGELKLQWDSPTIEAVALYINRRYYQYPVSQE